MKIQKGDFALVQQYGSDAFWTEVVSIEGDIVTCNNGHNEMFEVSMSDIVEASQNDSVFIRSF
jgi:hypothetical protein